MSLTYMRKEWKKENSIDNNKHGYKSNNGIFVLIDEYKFVVTITVEQFQSKFRIPFWNSNVSESLGFVWLTL